MNATFKAEKYTYTIIKVPRQCSPVLVKAGLKDGKAFRSGEAKN
jgi:hypothetical protein